MVRRGVVTNLSYIAATTKYLRMHKGKLDLTEKGLPTNSNPHLHSFARFQLSALFKGARTGYRYQLLLSGCCSLPPLIPGAFHPRVLGLGLRAEGSGSMNDCLSAELHVAGLKLKRT